MENFHYRENFFDSSTKSIDIYGPEETPRYSLSLFYTSSRQKTFAYLGSQKHNFQIEGGDFHYSTKQEKSLEGKFKTPFRTVWEVMKDGETIGEFTTKMAFKPKMVFEGSDGESLLFESGFFSRSVTVTNRGGSEVMMTKSEYFKLASRHDIEILVDKYDPALLILLFQVFYEYQEHLRKKSN